MRAKEIVGKKCVRGYEVQILKSGAGFYIGTLDEDGFPMCRMSNEYAKTHKQAIETLWADRTCMENMFCNGGMGCMPDGTGCTSM